MPNRFEPKKELHLMEKCGGVYMTHGISNIQNTVVTENIKVKRNALKQLIFGIRNILTGGKYYE